MNRRHFLAFAICFSSILPAAQVTAQPATPAAGEPMTAVRKYFGAFNKGDQAAMANTFAVPGFILDGMAPHVWQGMSATDNWYRDVLSEGKQHNVSDYFITLGEPILSLWASHCITTSQVTAPMSSFPQP